MPVELRATRGLVKRYFDLFVNRRAYTIQAVSAREGTRSCYYYRPKNDLPLSGETIRRHLLGEITIGLYAINPATQSCKWVAIDADYSDAIRDLLKLRWELSNDGIESALERSRRGGHLWIFAECRLLASDCLRYVEHLASRVSAPIRGVRAKDGNSTAGCEGIEIFPKQDKVSAGEFGNAIRGPLGVHRGSGKRYWFYGADYKIEAQLKYLSELKKVSQEKMIALLAEVPKAGKGESASAETKHKFPSRDATGGFRESFSLVSHLSGKLRRSGRNYFTRCPSCAQLGRDRHGDNLAISVAEPNKYRCWAGCTKAEIRAALGIRATG